MLRQLKTRWMGLNDAAKASLVFMMVSFLNEGIRFITTPIYTRLLTAEEYGITSVYYSWEAILGVFTMLSLQYGIFNNGMFEFKRQRFLYIINFIFIKSGNSRYILRFDVSCTKRAPDWSECFFNIFNVYHFYGKTG